VDVLGQTSETTECQHPIITQYRNSVYSHYAEEVMHKSKQAK